MNLQGYFDRIGFAGTPKPDLDTLTRLHRLHLLAVPYENVDVQLRSPVDLDLDRIYDKIVTRRRGGWCYEMNGLLGWALVQIGFDVTRVNGGVMRVVRGDDAFGNHLVLLVNMEGKTWVADTGFGDGVIDPIPLEQGAIVQRGFNFSLEELEPGLWRFHNHQHGGAPSFDFRTDVADEDLFARKCQFLQTSTESPFVMNLVCQRFVEGGYDIQLGRLAKRVTPNRVDSWLLNEPQELVSRLKQSFGLDVPEVASLWPRILERHAQLFPT